jgi:hypothetical protein
MAVLAGVAMGLYFKEAFTLSGSPLNRFHMAHLSAYRISVVSWVLILVADLVVTICIWEAYRNNKPSIGHITSLLRLGYSIILLLAIIKLFNIWTIQQPSADADLIAQSISGFQSLWYVGLVLFGFHLISLALLIPTTTKIQIALRFLLIIGGIGYIALHGGMLIFSDFAAIKKIIEPIFMLPMILGELGLAIYMVAAPKKLLNTLTYPAADPAQSFRGHTQVTGNVVQRSPL